MVSSSSISNHTSSGYEDYLGPTNDAGAPVINAPERDNITENQTDSHELDASFDQLSLDGGNSSAGSFYRSGDQPQSDSIGGPLQTYPGQSPSGSNSVSIHATGDELTESDRQTALSPSVIYQQAFPQLAAAQLAQQQFQGLHHQHHHHQHQQPSGRQLYPTAYPTSYTVCVQNVSITPNLLLYFLSSWIS